MRAWLAEAYIAAAFVVLAFAALAFAEPEQLVQALVYCEGLTWPDPVLAPRHFVRPQPDGVQGGVTRWLQFVFGAHYRELSVSYYYSPLATVRRNDLTRRLYGGRIFALYISVVNFNTALDIGPIKR